MSNVSLRLSLFILLSASILFQNAGAASNYRWPSPQYESLEDLLYSDRFSALVDGCHRRSDATNQSTQAAEWLRFAYHDMATHNVDEGTGGLDGSIHFELARAENVGNGMTATQGDYDGLSNKLISKADIIALGAIHGIAVCNGPLIPFKFGRIDAANLGPEGVPEPQQTLEEHTEKFRKQGFNQSEMIALVACGHTIGSLRSNDFPDAVPGPPKEEKKGTVGFFDELDYPFGGHETFDESVISSPTDFRERCKSLLERMVNTVPKGVTLSDPIELLEEKVEDTRIWINETDQSLNFATGLRLAWRDGSTPPANRTTRLCWCDRYGPDKDCARKTARCTTAGAQILGASLSPYSIQQGINMSLTSFTVSMNSSLSVSEFWFEIDDHLSALNSTSSGSKPRKVVNTGGKNFEFQQDNVLWRLISEDIAGPGKFPVIVFRPIVGVRQSYPHPSLTLRLYQNRPLQHRDEKYPLSLNMTIPVIAGYNFYTAPLSVPSENLTSMVFDVLGVLGTEVVNNGTSAVLSVSNGSSLNGKRDLDREVEDNALMEDLGIVQIVQPRTPVEVVNLNSSNPSTKTSSARRRFRILYF